MPSIDGASTHHSGPESIRPSDAPELGGGEDGKASLFALPQTVGTQFETKVVQAGDEFLLAGDDARCRHVTDQGIEVDLNDRRLGQGPEEENVTAFNEHAHVGLANGCCPCPCRSRYHYGPAPRIESGPGKS